MLSLADDVEEGIKNPRSTTNQTSLLASNSRPRLSHSYMLSPTISRSETLSSAQPQRPKDNTASNQSIPSPSDSQSPLTQSSSGSATITPSETPPSPLPSSAPLLFLPDTQSTLVQPAEPQPLSRSHTPEEDAGAGQKLASLSGSEPCLLRSDTQFTAVPPSETLPSSRSRTPNAPRVTPNICPERGIEGSIELSSLPSSVALPLPLPDETVNVNLQRPTSGNQGGRVAVEDIG